MKVWDLHCDTLYELRRAEKAGTPKSFLHNDLHIDLEKLQQGDYLLQCFAAYVDLADPAPRADPPVSVLEEIDIFKRLMAAYPEKIAPVYTAADLERNRAEGKLSAMLTVEEGGCCKGSLGVLRRLQELGVRMMTLTWNYSNELAAPNANPGGPLVANTETGLTEQGFAFLEEMERLHITADVSHLSDKGFWDIANHSTRPFAASHSNCRVTYIPPGVLNVGQFHIVSGLCFSFPVTCYYFSLALLVKLVFHRALNGNHTGSVFLYIVGNLCLMNAHILIDCSGS